MRFPRPTPIILLVAVFTYGTLADSARDQALVVAVENGDLEATAEALATGADPDARRMGDQLQPTVLMLASAADRADLTAVLVDAGAALEAVDGVGATALMWAVTRRANNALEVLVRAGADVRRRHPLLAALTHHNEDAVALLIEGGADVDAQGGEPKIRSPLMLAAERGYLWAARWLLDAGADIDAHSPDDGSTALDLAMASGHQQLVDLLQARGARRSSELSSSPADSPVSESSSPPELSPDALSWAYLVLQRMGEPGLCQGPEPAAGIETFRFVWVRTFDEPLMVRVEGHVDDSAVLTAAVLDGQGGYEFGLPGRRVTRELKGRRWRAFREDVAEASFWSLPASAHREDTLVLDGSSWLLEGRRNGSCHVVWRLSPEADGPAGDFRRLCRKLLDFAKLGSQARPVY